MKIIKTKRLQDNVNFVIEYEKDGQLYGLIISAENVVKNYEAVEQLRALDVLKSAPLNPTFSPEFDSDLGYVLTPETHK